jgi:hypothetical protein
MCIERASTRDRQALGHRSGASMLRRPAVPRGASVPTGGCSDPDEHGADPPAHPRSRAQLLRPQGGHTQPALDPPRAQIEDRARVRYLRITNEPLEAANDAHAALEGNVSHEAKVLTEDDSEKHGEKIVADLAVHDDDG